jgi:mevalonate kinase
MIQTTAPAKLILFGEHAVVHGQPAIAIPITSLQATASVQFTPDEPGLRINAVDLNEMFLVNIGSDDVDHALVLTVRLVLKLLGITTPPNAVIKITSTIPMASGLGSGAAVSTCLARAVAASVGHTVAPADLNSIIYEIEKLHHGTPSGIDNTVIVYEQPVYFVRGKPIEVLSITTPLTLVVADTGVSMPTHIPVSDVRKLLESDPQCTQPVLDAIGHITRDARTALTSGDVTALGPLMTQNHQYLQQLTVSSAMLDQLVEAALNAGALGAKLSGAGRGGNMIALVTTDTIESVKQALTEAGATRVFQTTVHAL